MALDSQEDILWLDGFKPFGTERDKSKLLGLIVLSQAIELAQVDNTEVEIELVAGSRLVASEASRTF